MAVAKLISKPMADIEMGTGNVFVDLGLPDPQERQLRVKLAVRLNVLLEAEGLTQTATAKRLGLAQPHVSELKNYKLGRFSSERLLYFVTLMNRDVEIFIRPRQVSRMAPSQEAGVGEVMVWAAA